MINSKPKILIVEDEHITAIDLRKTLQKIGYEVTGHVNSGEDAVSSVKAMQPDIVLMDIMLKGSVDGIEAAQIISGKLNIPVVYLTALSDSETLKKAKMTEPIGFVLKPFDEKSLYTTIEIALYKHEVEEKLKEKTKELEEERNKNDELLKHILPADVINELKLNGTILPRHYEKTTILFTDFQGFSNITSILTPEKLLNELNEIFSAFDEITEKYGLEKLKTIGDTYMIGGGFPKESSDHAVRIVQAAMEMSDFVKERSTVSSMNWDMRIGINSGQVVAGIVGAKKYTYDVWGDTVNIASRIENNSLPGKINISGTTYELIKNHFDCNYRGKLEIKGKGKVDMYFVNAPKTKPELLEI
jgi:class 3 adenylate cyclase